MLTIRNGLYPISSSRHIPDFIHIHSRKININPPNIGDSFGFYYFATWIGFYASKKVFVVFHPSKNRTKIEKRLFYIFGDFNWTNSVIKEFITLKISVFVNCSILVSLKSHNSKILLSKHSCCITSTKLQYNAGFKLMLGSKVLLFVGSELSRLKIWRSFLSIFGILKWDAKN